MIDDAPKMPASKIRAGKEIFEIYVNTHIALPIHSTSATTLQKQE